ncbi:hypothetical protein GJ744_009838 [Endocarpon pusillum]|uniref:Amino acid transporter transmembrane domain-containing protein n=1 Tax=Endocarpon pusillum TaxID=364733 RepID=A0A8H7E8Q5_9EURO|nr:hypothetical protein GJ744_009838 [Endocarpon pusillum]
MSFIKAAGNARQLSVIESAYSQELDSTTMHDSSEDSTDQKDFAVPDISLATSSSTIGGTQDPSQMSSLTLNLLSNDDLHHQRQASKDIEKSDAATLSSDESGPQVAEMVNHDKQDPFAQEAEGGVQYRTMAWWQAGMVMIAETVSLGILSLPSALATLGLIPGLILLLSLGGLSTYTGLVIGQFKLRHPHIHSMADAGMVLFGRIGGEIIGVGQLLFFVFIMGSHILTFSIMMNAITSHAACTIVFMLVGMVLSFLLTIPRTLKNLSWWSITSFISIIAAVTITMASISVSRPRTGKVDLWPDADVAFHQAFLAVTNIVFAYAGHVAFFTFISELRKPEDFPKALCLLQGCDVAMYVITAVVIYHFAGDQVKSPALDSAGPLIRKVAYGVAIPTIVVAGVVNGHVAVKYLYVRLFRNSGQDGGKGGNIMYQTTFKARGIWVAINAVLWLVAWVIAEGVPVFNDLLGLTSALFASWFTFGLSGLFWFSLNRGRGWWKNWRMALGSLVAALCFLIGLLICVIGLYASSMSIRENSQRKMAGGSFSCADNSGAKMVGHLDGGKVVEGRALAICSI